jgi:hypothetical protein
MNWHLFAFTKTLSTKGVFTFLFLCLISVASGQAGNEKGKPFVKNYSPELYDGLNTNWSVIQGDDGIMYFGNPTAESDILQDVLKKAKTELFITVLPVTLAIWLQTALAKPLSFLFQNTYLKTNRILQMYGRFK